MTMYLPRACAYWISGLAALSILSACRTIPVPETVPEKGLTEHALVTGSLAGLRTFNAKLLELEGVGSNGDAYIACAACLRLSQAMPPSKLDYYFAGEHKSKPRKFHLAEQYVKNTLPEANIKLVIDKDLIDLGNPACPAPPPVHSCKTAQWCVETDQCDKTFATPGCQRCVPPF
jgi:hypothetical protein